MPAHLSVSALKCALTERSSASTSLSSAKTSACVFGFTIAWMSNYKSSMLHRLRLQGFDGNSHAWALTTPRFLASFRKVF